jgi:hypothetical protein
MKADFSTPFAESIDDILGITVFHAARLIGFTPSKPIKDRWNPRFGSVTANHQKRRKNEDL